MQYCDVKKKKKQQMHFLKPKQEMQNQLALSALCNKLKTAFSVSNANILQKGTYKIISKH